MSMNLVQHLRYVFRVGFLSRLSNRLVHHKRMSIVGLDRSLHGQLWRILELQLLKLQNRIVWVNKTMIPRPAKTSKHLRFNKFV